MQAALYLRSSKDRSDVSIDAQRRELLDLAKSKNLVIVEEFADAVESGKDDQRPGFQSMLSQLKSRDRAWSYLLALDTSRIARNQYLAHALHYECDKRNIKILYAKMPETGSVVDVVIRAVMQSFDQLHSLMSKEKGMAGMAENVKQGFRAGGRAPLGYKLQSQETGAMREGVAVTKSKLVPGDKFETVQKYLKARALQVARSVAADEAGLLGVAHTSLLGLDWNALTYAGHTVWNVQNERLPSGGYKGNVKRKPRAEWVIQKDTHEPIITNEEAESILKVLEASTRADPRKTKSEYLFSGLMVNQEGIPYHGADGQYYRCGKGKRLKRDEIEPMLIKHIMADMKSSEFIADLIKTAKRSAQPIPDDEVKQLKSDVNKITGQIGKLTDIAAEAESPRPWLEKIGKLEKEREDVVARLERAASDYESAQILMTITERDMRLLLAGFTSNVDFNDVPAVKEFLSSILDKIVLTESPRLTCSIHYSISSGDSVASPRLRDTIPVIKLIRMLKLAA
jgi:site-specific DNA recombinase